VLGPEFVQRNWRRRAQCCRWFWWQRRRAWGWSVLIWV